jgi:hypothetical protein
MKRPRIVAAVGGFTARGAAANDAATKHSRVVAAVGNASGRGTASAEGAAEVRGEGMRLLATGAKMHHRENKGGRNPDAARNREMALKFKRRMRSRISNISASAIKAEMGEAYGLGRRASIDAIDRGLKDLCGKES